MGKKNGQDPRQDPKEDTELTSWAGAGLMWPSRMMPGERSRVRKWIYLKQHQKGRGGEIVLHTCVEEESSIAIKE